MRLQDLLEQRGNLVAEMRSITDSPAGDGGDLSAEQSTKFDSLKSQVESIEKRIERQRTVDEAERRMQGEQLTGDGREIRITSNAIKLRAYDDNREGREASYRDSLWFRAFLGDERAQRECRDRGIEVRAHSASTNAAGGVLVPESFETAVIRLREQHGVFRRSARVLPMSSDSAYIPRCDSGLTPYFTGEGAEITASDSTWSAVQLSAKKLAVLTRVSSELTEDSAPAILDQLAVEVGLAFSQTEDRVGFVGAGVSTDGGIVGVNVVALDGSHGMANVAAASGHNLLTEIDSADIISLMSVIPQYARAGSAFYCSPSAMDVVFNAIKIAATGNSLENLANMAEPRFLGYPIRVCDVFPDDVTEDLTSAAMIGFGNLSQAVTFGERRGLRLATTDARFFEYDQIALKATSRIDINAHSMGSDTVKSPYAVLIGA